MDLFMLIMGFFINTTSRICMFFISLVRNGFYNRQNRISRGVVRPWGRLDEAKILNIADPRCSVMITGGAVNSSMRERLMVHLASQMNQINVPVIILHRGNAMLEQRVRALQNAVICGKNERNYDSFRDLNANAIADLLLDNLPANSPYALNLPQAKSYIRGLSEFYLLCQGTRPSLNSLCDCTDVARKGYMAVLNALQSALAQRRITQAEFNGIKALLDAGQSQEVALHTYLNDTLQQLSSCTPALRTGLKDAAYISLRRAIARRLVLCVDVSAISNEAVFYNLFVNELIRSEADHIGSPYLILDGISIKSSPALTSLLEEGAAPSHCICCENVYAALNDGKPGTPLFNSLASGCGLHISLMQPSGAAASLWSEYYGTYQKQKRSVSYNSGLGRGHGTQILPGASHGQMVQYTDVDEHIWRPDEFTKLKDLELICVVQNSGGTKYIKARMTPEP